MFAVNSWRHDPIEIPHLYRRHRIWRDTPLAKLAENASRREWTLVLGLLGHEWDEDVDNGFRPHGLQRLSETTVDNVRILMDEGSLYDTGTVTHHLTLYKHQASGAIVFNSGKNLHSVSTFSQRHQRNSAITK